MDNCFDSEEEYEEAGTCYDFTKKTWRDDVTFLIEDQRLYATKAVLAMASPVFETMFGTTFRERDEEEVPLPGKVFEDFNEFLHCIYPKSQKKIDAKNVYKVLPLADEYDVKYLIKECKRFLSNHLTNDQPSTQELLVCHALATRHKFQRLREVCAKRLSDAGLKEIESTGTVCSDTETLLQIHKDILRRHGESLEETRTELVDLYLKKDLTVNDGHTPLSISETKGAIIKFKLNIASLDENERKESNHVSLWNIDFKVVIKKAKRVNEDCLVVLLASIFPGSVEHNACTINAKFQLKNIEMEYGQHYCFTMKDMEFSKAAHLSHGYRRKLANLIEEGLMVDGNVDIVVYFMVSKPFVRDQ